MPSGKKIPLHFAHANGFPIGSYQAIFNALGEEFEIFGKTKFAHDPAYPINPNLSNLVDEMIAYLEQHVAKPVYLVGHSMGGILSFMTACQRPDLVKGLIMLDPPITSGFSRVMFKLLKKTAWIDKFTPAGKTKTRCQSWPAGTDLVAYFKARALFKNFTDACIKDYVNAVIEHRDGLMQLNYDALIETNIYRNVPHNLHHYYHKLKVPSLLLTGENSEVCTPRFLGTFVKKTQIPHKKLAAGGHMFPMEQPQKVAAVIGQTLKTWHDHTE
ncbi:alpha/beta fold hydrolase [Paraglaciecola aestuariivivens]